MQTTSSPTSATPSSDYKALPFIGWSVLAVLFVVGGFASQATSRDNTTVFYQYSFAIGTIVIYAFLAGITLLLALPYEKTTEALGLNPFSWRWVGIAIGLIIGVLIVAAALEPILHGGQEQGLSPEEWDPDRAGAFLVNGIVIATVVPFGSFTTFRDTTGPDLVIRHNLYPAAPLNGNYLPSVSSGQALAAMEKTASALPPGFGYEWTDIAYQEKQAKLRGGLPKDNGLLSTGEPSFRSHLHLLRQGTTTIARHPQGYGLGNAGVTALRFDAPRRWSRRRRPPRMTGCTPTSRSSCRSSTRPGNLTPSAASRPTSPSASGRSESAWRTCASSRAWTGSAAPSRRPTTLSRWSAGCSTPCSPSSPATGHGCSTR